MLNTTDPLTDIKLASVEGETRRNDYMEPCLIAIISPELEVYKFSS